MNLLWVQYLSNLDASYHSLNLFANLFVDAQQDIPIPAGREVPQPRRFVKKITEQDTVWVVWCCSSSARRHKELLRPASRDAAA